MTLQNFFRLYNKLSGMTGTAMTEAAEFNQIYNLGRPYSDESSDGPRGFGSRIWCIERRVRSSTRSSKTLSNGTRRVNRS